MNVIVIREDGYIGVEEVCDDFEALGKIIDTDMIEIVRPAISIQAGILPEDVRILCDEEGRLKDSEYNSIASVLYSGGVGLNDFIVGTIILCKYGESGISSLPNEYISSIMYNLEDIKKALELKDLLIVDKFKV